MRGKKRSLLVLLLALAFAASLSVSAVAAFAEGAGYTVALSAENAEFTTNVVEDTSDMFEMSGTSTNSNSTISWRYGDVAQYWTYKLEVTGDTSAVTMAATLKRSSNMAVSVSTDNADWAYILTPASDGFAADYTEANEVTSVDGDFMHCYYRLGEYFGGGSTLYIRFGAYDTAQGNGMQVAEDITFYYNWVYSPTYIDLSVNAVTVDVASSDFIFEDAASQVGENNLGKHRYADAERYFTYLLVMDKDAAEGIYMKVNVSGVNRAISFSPDNEAWAKVCDAPNAADEYYGAESALADGVTFYYGLDDYIGSENIEGEEKAVVYVKFHASDTSQGFGADLYSLQFFNGSVAAPVENPGVLLAEGKLAHEISVTDDTVVHESKNSSIGSYLGEQGRVAAGSDAYFIYKLDLPSTASDLSVSMNSINGLLFTASADGQNYESFTILNASAAGDGAALTYDLSSLLSSDGANTVYLRFGGMAGQESMLVSLFVSYNDSAVYKEARENEVLRRQAFTAGDSSESEYRVSEDDPNALFLADGRVYNNDAEGIYRFTYGEDAKAVNLSVSVGGSYVVSVSQDGETWTDIRVSERQFCSESWYETQDEFTTDISSYVMEGNDDRTFYVRVADSVTNNPYGAALRGMVVEELSDVYIGEPEGGGNVGLIVGLSVGGAAVVAAAVVAAVVLVRKNNAKKKNNTDEGGEE